MYYHSGLTALVLIYCVVSLISVVVISYHYYVKHYSNHFPPQLNLPEYHFWYETLC